MPIDLIDTIKPKNNGTFPMVEAEDVVVGKGTADEKRLPEALAEAGKVAAVDTAMPEAPADDHVPSTQLLAEELAKKLSLTGGTLTGSLTLPTMKVDYITLNANGSSMSGQIVNIPNSSKRGGATGIVCVRDGQAEGTANRLRFFGISGGDTDSKIYLGDAAASIDTYTTVFGLHLNDNRTWARHDLWFTDKSDDYQGARTWWGLVQDGDELRIVKDKGTPKAYLPLSGGTLTGNLKFANELSELWVSNIRSVYGTRIFDATPYKGLNFLGIYQLTGFISNTERGKVFFTQENATTNWLDVTTLKEGGTPIADKYAAKSHQHAASDITGLPTVTVDAAMSDTSENPVQNKAIKAYVDGLVGDIQAALAAI